jgi:phosphoglycerate dehydrogenase-like enzyme
VSGWLGGAVLEVYPAEPLSGEPPLYGTPNLILTPHTSWSSDQVVERSVRLFVENLQRFAAGQALENVVDLEAGY